MFAVDFFGAADQILVLDSQGGMQKCKSLDEFFDISKSIPNLELMDKLPDVEECIAEEKESGLCGAPATNASPDSRANDAPTGTKNHKEGDWSTWQFIFRAVPLSTHVIWVCLLLIAAILVRVPGKKSHPPV